MSRELDQFPVIPPAGGCGVYCLCVKIDGEWKRAATVMGPDPSDAFEQAIANLPPALRDNPILFRDSSLCPPADADR